MNTGLPCAASCVGLIDMCEIQVASEGKKDPFIEAQKAFNMFDTDGSGICE